MHGNRMMMSLAVKLFLFTICNCHITAHETVNRMENCASFMILVAKRVTEEGFAVDAGSD